MVPRCVINGLFLLILCSCSSTGNKGEQLPFKEYDLTHKSYQTEIYSKSAEISCIGKYLLIFDENKAAVTLFDRLNQMKRLQSYGSKGNGPGEFITMWQVSDPLKSDRVSVYDPDRKKLIYIQVREDNSENPAVKFIEVKNNPKQHEQDGFALGNKMIAPFNDDYLVGVSIISPSKTFSLYDANLNFINFFGEYPVSDSLSLFNSINKLQGAFRAGNNFMIFVPRRIPSIYCYQLKRGKPVLKWKDSFETTYYELRNNDIKFSQEKSKGQTKDMIMGNKYIYVLYNDSPLKDFYQSQDYTFGDGNMIFVYDYNGKRIAKLNLDIKIGYFAVDKEETKLYGAMRSPEFAITEFDLPSF